MSITASAFAKKKIDISAFVDHIRESAADVVGGGGTDAN